MATRLAKFTDAYATVTVATYEPLVLRWVSTWGLGVIATDLANRAPKAALMKADGLPTAVRLANRRSSPLVETPEEELQPLEVLRTINDLDGRPFPPDINRKVRIPHYPDAAAVGDNIYPLGLVRVVTRTTRDVGKGILSRMRMLRRSQLHTGPAGVSLPRTVPFGVNPYLGSTPATFDLHASRRRVLASLSAEVDRALAAQPADRFVELGIDLDNAIRASSYSFMPVTVEEALSPIGVAHFYRNLFFNLEEGVGPIEQAFTIAPLETLEVVYEMTRRQIHEEQVEYGSETVSELATEERDLDEVSDKLSSMIQRDSAASMSVSGGGGVAGVWNVSGEASADLKTSSQRSREETSRRVTEMTTRSSERITKSFSLKTRDVTEIATTNLTRRVIRNDSEDPVSYGLRRVLRKVQVKVQDIGPSLVWQIYICEPGGGLATSKLVHFREPSDIPQPSIPPGAPPRPQGDTDTGTGSSDVAKNLERNTDFVTVQVAAGPGRVVTSVMLDSITDLEGGGKDDQAPSPRPDIAPFDVSSDAETGTYAAKVPIRRGDAGSVSFTYSYSWIPSAAVITAWEQQVEVLRAQATEALNQQKFDREKALITEHRRIRTRPPADLRREERYEVLNRMISEVFGAGDDVSSPTPLEIEYFHRYFDIEAMFTVNHPSWWKPRYARRGVGFGRDAYAITSDSEPAPMGSSLTWAIQPDGDTRRNEFLNSPWVRACIPIRKGRERAAIAWLAKHVEGERGYDPNKNPLKSLLEEIESRYAAQQALGAKGAEYVRVDTSPADGAPSDGEGAVLGPEAVYPVIHEFTVTVPTDGFVYERLVPDGGP